MLDLRGIPSHVCGGCGGDTFKILARFADYEMVWYTTNGHCANEDCKAMVTVPCLADLDG